MSGLLVEEVRGSRFEVGSFTGGEVEEVGESESREVGESESRKVGKSESQKVQESGRRKVGEFESQKVQESAKVKTVNSSPFDTGHITCFSRQPKLRFTDTLSYNNYMCNFSFFARSSSTVSLYISSGTQQSTGQTEAHCGSS
jgi:hypothetical protein